MMRTDKPTTTASAPETRTKHSICRFQEASDYNERTIPAEKPTQTQFNSWLWPNQTLGKRASGALREEHNALLNAYAQAQAQAAQLAEALRCAEMVLAERGVELKEITRALTNYESEVQS